MQSIPQQAVMGHVIEEEIAWFQAFCQARARYFESSDGLPPNYVDLQLFDSVRLPLRPGYNPYDLLCQELWKQTQKKFPKPEALSYHAAERLVLILALLPHIRPDLTDYFKEIETASGSSLNSVQGIQAQVFIPSAETALYLLAGSNLKLRLGFQSIFYPQHHFAQHGILSLESTPTGIPTWRGALQISREVLYQFSTGEELEPQTSPDFPASKLSTEQTWDDLVVPHPTRIRIQELLDWIKYYEEMAEHPEFARERKGYRCLLVGEPGTGKTMLGRLLSKETRRPVYRIALDKIVSKYVGETTKNIAKIFQAARHRQWILFCDEGDALFSKRSTKTQSAQDTYVNQDIAYLLQEIEDYPGIIVVATNYSQNMDKAFQRRFDTRIDFRKPETAEIIQLLENAFKAFSLDPELDLPFIAQELKGHITGAQVTKIKHYLGLQAIKHKSWEITLPLFCESLHRLALKIPDFAGRRARLQRFKNESP